MMSGKRLLLTILIAQAFLMACTKEQKVSPQVVSMFNITLSSSFNDDGTMSYNSWSKGDRCRFFPISGTSAAEISAPPLVEGKIEADFRVKMSEDIASGAFVVTYPFDAGWSFDSNLNYDIPSEQTGKIETLLAGFVKEGTYKETREVTLEPVYGVLTFVHSGKSVKSVEVSSKGGENLSGKISADIRSKKFTASESSVRISFQSPRDFDEEHLSFILAPSSLSKGLSIKVTTASGETKEYDYPQVKEIKQGKVVMLNTEGTMQQKQTELVICGDNMVYMIRPEEGVDFRSSVFWSLDVKTISSVLQIEKSRCDHVDECKIVDGGTKLLATSSYGFAFLMDIATKEVIWCTNNCPNAHTAVLLPGNRVAVAASTGNSASHNNVLVYDLGQGSREVCRYALKGAHGLVWDEARQRLYAAGMHSTKDGYGALLTLSLKDWESESPSLKLEKEVFTNKYTTAFHDLQPVDANRLVVACRSAWFYNVNSGTLTEIPHFSQYQKIKSLNYNVSTGQCWYTAADNRDPEPTKDTSTRILCYTEDINGRTIHRKIEVPQDVYKVRVINY